MAQDYNAGSVSVNLGMDISELDKGVQKAAKNLEALSSSFNNAQKEVGNSLAKLDSAVWATNTKISNATDSLKRTMNENAGQIKGSINGVTSAVRASESNITASIQRMDKNAGTSLKAVVKNTETVGTAVSKLSARVRTGFEGMSRSMNNLATSTRTTNNAINDSIGKMSNRLNTLNNRVMKFSDNTATAFKKLQNSSETGFLLLAEQLEKIAKSLSNLEISTRKFQSTFASNMKSVAKSSKVNADSVVSDLERIAKASVENASTNATAKVTKTAKKGTTSGNASNDKYIQNFVSLGDAKLANLNKQYGTIGSTIAGEFGKANEAANTLTGTISSGLFGAFSKASFYVFLLRQGLGQVTDLVSGLISPGIEFTKQLEVDELGMAGILMSMTKLGDKALEFNDAIAISKGVVRDLNQEAVKTAATSEELVGTFRALLAPGLGAGMDIEQIKKFTVVGVNAVKAIGLDGRQLVQELRDLVQGGIQPASSTLATALGLKDSDIKQAKNSAEGLFKFLMDRIEGFGKVVDYNGKTLKGMLSQIAGGYQIAMSNALDPLYQELKASTQEMRDAMFTEDMSAINPEYIEYVKTIATHITNLFESLKAIAKCAIDTLTPAIEVVGRAIAFVMDNFELVAAFVGAGYISRLAGNFLALANNSMLVQQSQSSFAKSITLSAQSLEVLRANASNTFQSVMSEGLNAYTVLTNSINQQRAAETQRAQAAEVASKLIKDGKQAEASFIAVLAAKYEQLGYTALEAATMQNQAAQLVKQGLAEQVQKIDALIVKQTESAIASEKQHQAMLLLSSAMSSVAGLLLTLGGLIGTVDNETAGFTSSLAKGATTMGMGILVVGQMVSALNNLVDMFKNVQKAAILAWAAANPLMALAAGGATLVGGLTLAGRKVNGGSNDVESIWEDLTYSKEEKEEANRKRAEKKAAAEKKAQEEREMQERIKRMQENVKNLQNKFPTKSEEANTGTGGKQKYGGEGRLAKSAYKALEAELKKLNAKSTEMLSQLESTYKNDLVSTQDYVETKLALEKEQIQNEITNLEKRKEVAKEYGQESDITNFDNQIEQLKEKLITKQNEAIREQIEQYKKLETRMQSIEKNYQSMVGVSEDAFNTSLIKEFSADYSRMAAELLTANKRLADAISSQNTTEISIWQTRKSAAENAIKQLNTVVTLKKLEKQADMATAEVAKANLQVQEQYLSVQRELNQGFTTDAYAESKNYSLKKEHLNEYIDYYTTIIAKYEAMAQAVEKLGNGSTEMFNTYKSKALEAKEALAELTDATDTLASNIKETFEDELADAFQAITWQEKTAKEAFKDFGKAVLQEITSSVYKEMAAQVTKGFTNLFNNNKKNKQNQQIEETINVKVTANLAEFNKNISDSAIKYQESMNNTMLPAIQDVSSNIQNILIPQFNSLAEVIANITGKPLGNSDSSAEGANTENGSNLNTATSTLSTSTVANTNVATNTSASTQSTSVVASGGSGLDLTATNTSLALFSQLTANTAQQTSQNFTTLDNDLTTSLLPSTEQLSMSLTSQIVPGLTQFTTALAAATAKLNNLGGNAGDAGDDLDDLGDNTKEATTETTTAAKNTSKANSQATTSAYLMGASLVASCFNLGDFGTALQAILQIMMIANAVGGLKFAKGGYVSGAGTGTSDSIPARLSNGEYVVKASSVKAVGTNFLDMLNSTGGRSNQRFSGRLPKFAFAEGGLVTASQQSGSQAVTADTTSQSSNNVQPQVVMQMTFQSLDPASNMNMMKQQYPTIRSLIINDMQKSSSMRKAIKGAV